MNQTTVTICGRLVTEPELRNTAKGDVVSMRVVVNEWRRENGGGYVDGPSNFYTVSAWGELGKEIMQCLRKGHRVVVAGVLRVNSYQVEGRNLERLDVRAEHIGPDLRFGTAMYRPRQRTQQHAGHTSGGGADRFSQDTPPEPVEESPHSEYEVLEPGADPAADALASTA